MSATASTPASGRADGIHGLLRRLLGDRAAEFRPAPLPDPEPQPGTTFEVATVDGRVELRGATPVAQASALRWYLTRVCGLDLAPDAPDPAPPARLPEVTRTRRRTPFRHRTHFNAVTFSYTTAFWDRPRWERAIDRMALHGVTTPLALTGQEAVWRTVLARLGMADPDIRDFLGGPGYLPFTWMGCTERWGGPLPASWIEEHAQLGRWIVERERDLGMTPVLQGFGGHLPTRLGMGQPIHWFEFETRLLDPLAPEFRRIGAEFVREQTRLFGTDHLYAADPFIEMVPPATDPDDLAAVARAVYEAMAAADPHAVWVTQSWPFAYRSGFWTPERVRAFLDAVPADRLLVWDLWGEHRPLWRDTEAFHGRPWVWCLLHNFGGRPGMHGKLPHVATELATAIQSPERGRLSGVGRSMEAEGADPAVHDHFTDLLWHLDADEPGPSAASPWTPFAPRSWVRDYARRRYGRRIPEAESAWELLLDTVYSGRRAGGPPPSLVIARPGAGPDLAAAEPPHPGARPPEWPVPDLAEAWRLLLVPDDPDPVGGRYGRDLADVAGQVLTLRARDLHGEVTRAFAAGDPAATDRAARAFLRLLADLDDLLATRPEYLLGPWLDAALSWGRTENERRLYEWNARRLVTVWGPAGSRLHDYSGRHWAGLVSGYHLPRWRIWTEHLTTALAAGADPDPEALDARLTAFEEEWCRASGEPHPREPVGGTQEVARRLYATHVPTAWG